MFESKTAVIITFVLVAVVLAAVVPLLRKYGVEHTDVSNRLRTLALENADYTIYIGMPADSPALWDAVSDVTDSTLSLQDGTVVPYSDVRAFAVVYANGQLVDAELEGLPLPPGTSGLSPSSETNDDILEAGDLVTGKDYIEINYGACPAHPNRSDHYSTTLTNISDEPIRVERFAGYAKTTTGWRLFTVTNTFYSAEEFQEWYGLKNAEWIMPGASATDPNNYGARPVLWAYYCRSKSGKRFITGESLE
jgi:hypothetical protein